METRDLSLWCDPVFLDPFCEGLNAVHPARAVDPARIPRCDAVFLSHRHLDHFDVASLRLLPRSLHVFLPRDPLMERTLRELGFGSVTPLAELERVTFGDTMLCTTPSRNPVPELGLVVRDRDGTFWNQVDTVSTPASIAAVTGVVGHVDYLLAPWQPFRETNWHLGGDARFPYGLYETLLRDVLAADAHCVTPGANGLCYVGRARSLNRVAFPVTPERFARDLARFPGAPAVRLAQPGAVAHLEAHAVHVEAGAAPWITPAPDAEPIAFFPPALGAPFEAAFERPPGVLSPGHPWEELLAGVAHHASTVAARARMHACDAVYQLVVEDGGILHPGWLDLAGPATWRPGWSPLRSCTSLVTGHLLRALAAGRVSLSYVVTSGEYRWLDTTCTVREGRLVRPEPPLQDPLLAWLAPRAEALLEGALALPGPASPSPAAGGP